MHPVFILHIHLYVQDSWADEVWAQTLDNFLHCPHGLDLDLGSFGSFPELKRCNLRSKSCCMAVLETLQEFPAIHLTYSNSLRTPGSSSIFKSQSWLWKMELAIWLLLTPSVGRNLILTRLTNYDSRNHPHFVITKHQSNWI